MSDSKKEVTILPDGLPINYVMKDWDKYPLPMPWLEKDETKLNYHKLVNLRKRFADFKCDATKEILAVIDKHIEIQKAVSADLKKKRQEHYMWEKIICPVCKKEFKRSYYHKHKKTHE